MENNMYWINEWLQWFAIVIAYGAIKINFDNDNRPGAA